MTSARPVFVLRLEAKPGADPIRALRSLLKIAGRKFNLRCVDAYEITQPQPERTRAHEMVQTRSLRSTGRNDRSDRRRTGRLLHPD